MTYAILNWPLFTFSKQWDFGILTYLVIEWLRQLAKLKRTWNLAAVLQIVQKITENYCPCLYLSTGQVWWLRELWFKRYIQKSTLSHVLILMVTSQIGWIVGWLKIQKLEYLENETQFFYEIKKFLLCASDCTFWEVIAL